MGRRPRYGAPLSPREREVLGRLAHGLSRAEIARRQGVAPETVKTQLEVIYRKLGVAGRFEAAALVWAAPDRFRSWREAKPLNSGPAPTADARGRRA